MTNRSCQVEGCQGKYFAKGFCAKHYHANRLQETKILKNRTIEPMAAAVGRVCQVPDCNRTYFAKGFCATHYQKNRQQTLKNLSVQNKQNPENDKQLTGLSMGITRQLDTLGRIVLPIELRRSLNIEISDSLEIFVDQEMIILRKYSPGCFFCGSLTNDSVYFKGKVICNECVNTCKSGNQ